MRAFDAGAGPATVLDDLCNTNQVRCIEVVISGGSITAVKDEDFVGPNHLIIWKMNPLGAPYTFPDNGVDFKLSSPVRPANEFRCQPIAQRHLFFCLNRNSVARTYTYTVTLKDSSGNSISFDPKIVNQ